MSFATGLLQVPEVYVWTDGSCHPNPGPGGWGAYIQFVGGGETRLHGAHPDTTNNQMELTAAIEALQYLYNERGASTIVVRSDSEYVCNLWGLKPNASPRMPNWEKWTSLRYAIGLHMDVRFSWVKGHNGDVGNEIADKLALAGRLSLRSV